MNKRSIRETGVEITNICFGTSGLGDMPDTYGYAVGETRARETLEAIFAGPVNVLDTSRNYGLGKSEQRVGDAIRAYGGLPDGFVISTKLDRDMETNRLDADRARRSIEESLTALGVQKVGILHLHDPEYARDLDEITATNGAIDALFKMKDEGLADAVGLAMGRVDVMFPILRAYPFDVMINHNRWTLLNRAADEMFDYAQSKNIAIMNAAPFAGGVLAKGASVLPKITYQPADDATLAPVHAIEAICAEHKVPTGAAALQFSLQDHRITSTIVGVTKPERIAQTLAWAKMAIPPAAQTALSALPFQTDDPESNRIYRPG